MVDGRASTRLCRGRRMRALIARYGESLDQRRPPRSKDCPDGIGRHDLQEALPRVLRGYAADCALWDLQARDHRRAGLATGRDLSGRVLGLTMAIHPCAPAAPATKWRLAAAARSVPPAS